MAKHLCDNRICTILKFKIPGNLHILYTHVVITELYNFIIKIILIFLEIFATLKVIKQKIETMLTMKSIHLCNYYNAWIENIYIYIELELCSQTLKTVIENKQKLFDGQNSVAMVCIDFYISCQLMRELFECIQELHESIDDDITHTELNTDNILVAHNVSTGRYIKIHEPGFKLNTTKCFKHVLNDEDVKQIIEIAYDLFESNLHRYVNVDRQRAWFVEHAYIFKISIVRNINR